MLAIAIAASIISVTAAHNVLRGIRRNASAALVAYDGIWAGTAAAVTFFALATAISA